MWSVWKAAKCGALAAGAVESMESTDPAAVLQCERMLQLVEHPHA